MNKILKLNVALIASLLSLSLYSCSSDEPTDPTKDDEEEQVKDEPRDWSVTVYEDIWKGEGWVDLTNNSAECQNWKKQYEQYCYSEKSPTETNHWTNIWVGVPYKSMTFAQITKEVEQIVSFTRTPEPNSTTLSSIDLFTARVTGENHYVSYDYNPYRYLEDDGKTGWAITVQSSSNIKNGSTIVIPEEYSEWCDEHKQHLKEHSSNDGVDKYTWVINQNTFTISDIADIIRMVNWSQVESKKPYSYFVVSVEVHQYGTNLIRTWMH